MKRSNRRVVRFGLPVAALALALAGAATAGMIARATAAVTRVTVTETEYHLTFSRKTFSPGVYTFIALDKGKIAHSLAISGPGIRQKQLSGNVNPGGARPLTVTLRNGTYSIWCPVPGHAGRGMKATIKVGTGGTTAPATTKKSGWG
jgi:plastocyanin